MAAVITDSTTHEKYAINDISLIPHYAVLDPALTMGMPPNITVTTGMDALTHAVDAYIGRSNTQETREWSKRAVKLVFENISEAYNKGECVYRPLAELADVAGIADGLKSDRERLKALSMKLDS